MRRTECEKTKISQSDFSNLKLGQKSENLQENKHFQGFNVDIGQI